MTSSNTKRVKLFRIYDHGYSSNYGDDYTNISFSIGVTGWEEISIEKLQELQKAVISANLKKGGDYRLVIVEDAGVSIDDTISDYLARLEKERKEREKAQKAYEAEQARKKAERLAKKLNKDKLKKEELFEQLKQELGK